MLVKYCFILRFTTRKEKNLLLDKRILQNTNKPVYGSQSMNSVGLVFEGR